MIPDSVLVSRLNNNEKRVDPLKPRETMLNSLYGILGDEQFSKVVRALETGDLVANGDLKELVPYKELIGEVGARIDVTTWQDWELHVPNGDNSIDSVYLISSPDERVFDNIWIKTTDVNRMLEFTGQSGGQKPKMPPKLFAFLTVWYSRDAFTTAPEKLFSILEGREDVWGKQGQIDGRRGLDAIKEYIEALEDFETKFDAGAIDLDISFASRD